MGINCSTACCSDQGGEFLVCKSNGRPTKLGCSLVLTGDDTLCSRPAAPPGFPPGSLQASKAFAAAEFDEGAGSDDIASRYFDREERELALIAKGGLGAPTVHSGVPHSFSSGAQYYGEWQNSRRHGIGKIRWPDGASYEGEWRDNQACGKGRFLHADGDQFIGQWQRSLAHGKGVYYHQGRATYVGEWAIDVQEGHGVESWHLGCWFEGEFRGGVKHGHGCYVWSDGCEYRGRWQDDVIEGPGTYTTSDGRSYKGQWRKSEMDGIGMYVWPDGRKYVGQYCGDQKHGFGICQWTDGRTFHGYWDNGIQCGQGMLVERSVAKTRGVYIELCISPTTPWPCHNVCDGFGENKAGSEGSKQ